MMTIVIAVSDAEERRDQDNEYIDKMMIVVISRMLILKEIIETTMTPETLTVDFLLVMRSWQSRFARKHVYNTEWKKYECELMCVCMCV